LHDVAFTSFRSPAHEIAHTPMAISRDGSDAYLLSLQLAGRAELSQGGRDTVLKPGDLGIVDARRRFSVKLSGDVWRAAAILPRRADPAFAVRSVVAEVLGENLSTLLGVVVGHSVDGLAGDRLQRDFRLEALLAYMRRNCSDPDLSPSAAAVHLRISVRTVHKLMKRTERSFGE
jgi:AraC family transcriptional regulator, positive regulator of tynA and feaB